MEILKVDRTKLMTQSAYAVKEKVSKQLVSYWVKTGKVKSVTIEGATLVYLG